MDDPALSIYNIGIVILKLEIIPKYLVHLAQVPYWGKSNPEKSADLP